MSIRRPPANLAAPNLQTLGRGAIIERIHGRSFAGDAFNPGMGGQTRFAPICDASGSVIPTLYAADSLDAAIHETIFHDVPTRANRKRVSKTLITSRAHSRLELRRDLALASLRSPDLKRWRISRSSLIATSPKL
jgi:RES domain.